MLFEKPEVVIRLGSHAEKEYVLKLAPFLDGVIIGANLLESTPGASGSLLLSISGKKVKFFIDPMTYAYGAYQDPTTQTVRTDLEWIKSDQIQKDGKGKKHNAREIKSSYRALAERIGPPLSDAVAAGVAVSPDRFMGEKEQDKFCKNIAEYQLSRVAQVFEEDPELRPFIQHVPQPGLVFAPYFYVEPNRTEEWLSLNLSLMQKTASLGLSASVHGVICANVSHLKNEKLISTLLERLPNTGATGIWLWFSSFFEESAEEEELRRYRDLVRGLSDKMEVNVMHGGFFSLCLSKYGMHKVSHGVGYGEQKDVVPVIGQSIPTVRYYLPPLARRLGVPDIERAFDALGIKTPEDFHRRVCGCAVCRGVITTSLDEFSSFGDTQFSRPTAKRAAQTPAAAKRCRFHFLLSRLGERDRIRKVPLDDILRQLNEAAGTWGQQPSLRSASEHLGRWTDSLK
jgi:hypothetical protein